MSTYLLELGCEEIPARFIPKLLANLQALWIKQLSAHSLSFDRVEALGTYRRLTIKVVGLPTVSESQTSRLRGPLASISIGSDGGYLPPGLGFLKKNQLSESDVVIEDEQGKPYLVAYKTTEGRSTIDILPEIVMAVVGALDLPIAMKWGENQGPFVRPLHWILSLLDNALVPVDLFGISADLMSYGHRFLTQNPNEETLASGAPFRVSHADSYQSDLEAHFVLLSEEATQKIEASLYGDFDQDLLEEVSFLTEWPTPLSGQIDAKHLVLPQETIIECMKKHQKFFPVIKDNTLTSQFIVIADNVTDKSRAHIVAGNEKVLKARLDDVAFFWEEDQKTSLESNLKKLKTITFQKGLGSLYDKVQRLYQLSDYLSDVLGLSAELKQKVLRTATLCKADLASQMVYEMASLQGIMGRIYAEQDGEDVEVCRGIEAHYKPVFQASDPICGIVVGLADKCDTAVSCFCNGLIPTGSQDPWSVRRAVYGLIQSPYPLNLKACIEKAYSLLGKEPANKDACFTFFLQRIKTFITENNAPDTADSVMHYALTDLQKAIENAGYITELRTHDSSCFRLLVDMCVRIGRLASKGAEGAVNSALFQMEQEIQAYETFENSHFIKPHDFMPLVEVMTRYFDAVLVMDENMEIRQNRLAFLNTINVQILAIANFEKIAL